MAAVAASASSESAVNIITTFQNETLPVFFNHLQNNDPTVAQPKDVQAFASAMEKYNSVIDDPMARLHKDSVFVNLGRLTNNSLVLAAVESGNGPCLDFVLQTLGADPNLTFEGQQAFDVSPLILAVRYSNVDAVRILLRNPRTQKTLRVGGKSPDDELQALFGKKDPNAGAISELLFGKMDHVSQASEDQQEEALGCAGDLNGADPSKLARLQKLVNEYPHIANDPIGLEDTENLYTTLLYSASRANNRPAAELLIGKGADPAKVVTGQNTPLHVACYRGHVAVVRLLIATKRANPLAVNSLGETCLTCFKETLDVAVVQEIIALVNTPLVDEVLGQFRQQRIDGERVKSILKLVPVDMLVEQQQQTTTAKSHTTLLNEAVLHKFHAAAELLLQYGADPNGVNHADHQRAPPVSSFAAAAASTPAAAGRQQQAPIMMRGRRTEVDASIPAAAAVGGGGGVPSYVRGQVPQQQQHRGQQQQDPAVLAAAALRTMPGSPNSAVGASINAGLDRSRVPAPLHIAATNQDAVMVKLLLTFGAKPDLLKDPASKAFCDQQGDKKSHVRAFEFVVLQPGSARAALESFIRSPSPHTLDTPMPVDDDSNNSKSQQQHQQLPLLMHAILCRHVEAFDMLLRSSKVDLKGTHPHTGDTLLMMACRVGVDHFVNMLLLLGLAPDAKNTAGEAPLDVASTDGTRTLVRNALDRLKQEAANQRIQQFADSLPSRFDAAVPNVRVKPGTFARTPEGCLGAISAVLLEAIDAYQASFAQFGVNPICGMLASRLGGLVLQQRGDYSKIDVFLSLPPTQLFPTPLEDMYKKQIQRAWDGDFTNAAADPSIPAVVLAAFKGGTPERAAIEAACKKTTGTPKPTVHDAFACAAELSADTLKYVKAQWMQMVVWQPRLSYTCVVRVVIPRIEHEWTHHHAFPGRWDAAMNPNANRVTEIIDVRDADVQQFLGAVTAEWHKLPLLAQALAPRVLQISQTHIAPDKKLELAEREIEKSLDSIAKGLGEAARTMAVSDIPHDEANKVTMKKLFSEIVPEVLGATWALYAGSPGAAAQKAAQHPSSSPELFEGYFPIPPSELRTEVAVAVARTPAVLGKLRESLIKQMPQGTTADSQARFVAESQRIVAIASTFQPLPPSAAGAGAAAAAAATPFDPRAALAELYSRVIRPLHLIAVWRHMPMFAHGAKVDTALASNDVILVQASTGSGKSIFLPQHLAHSQPGVRVVVTQPRRLPVTCIGDRVRDLYGATRCGYQVGGGENPCEGASLQFRTDALYLNDIFMGGAHLDNTIVIIDEVHERSPVIDLVLLGVCHHIKSGTAKKVKLILASATVQSGFFRDAVRSFGLKFDTLPVDVTCPYPVQTIPNPSYFTFPDRWSDKMWEKRPKTAADDAKQLITADANNKVLVFLPNIGEVEAAKDRFNMMTNNNVPCLALHGRTEGAEGKVQSVRVVFANKIAETSITVPGLTHVLDFNLDMVSEVDGLLNSRSLKLELSTKAAQKQRFGRVGRVCPGNYKHYYDITQLPDAHPVSFDTLPNESLLQQEIRVRHFYGKSLFAGITGIPPLGVGCAVRPGLNFNFVPTDAADIKLAATLSMTPNMFQAFKHAMRQGKCPLAIMWLSAMIESREPVTRSGKLEAHHVTKFGGQGDQGVLLDVYAQFEQARVDCEAKGKKFVGDQLRKFCNAAALVASSTTGGGASSAAASAPPMPGAASSSAAPPASSSSSLSHHAPKSSSPLNPHWYENVHHRIGVITSILTSSAFNIPVRSWADYSSWAWDDIEDALLAGYCENVAVNVKTNVGDRPTMYYSLYHHLGAKQQTGLDIFNTSLLHNGPVKSLPEFCLFSLVERRGAKGFMKYCTSVSPEKFQEHTKRVVIQHSIGMVGAQINAYDKYFKGKSYANTTVERNSANFTPDLKERTGGGFSYMRAEFVVKGSPVQVALALAEIASDLYDAEQQVATLPAVKNVPCVDAFGTPGASFKMLEKVDRMLAARFKKATDPSRTDADLKSAIHGQDDMERALAVCNVTVNVLKLVVKGGFVRDIIVRGMTNFKDFDCECADPKAIQQKTWRKTVEEWRETLARRFGLKFGKPTPRKSTSPTGDGIVSMLSGMLELEIVMPWNTGMIPVQNMDMSCNNLRLEPGANELRLSYPVMMTAMDIVAQLRDNPPRTSCTRDALWQTSVPSGKKPEGYWRNKFLDATSPSMQARVHKFRGKGFYFVESCIADPVKGTVVLFHGTGRDAANAICKDPNSPAFRPSASGNLGAGLYVSRQLAVVETFARCHNGACILEATIDIGNLLMLQAKDMNWAKSNPGYDTAFLSVENSWRSWEEWCVSDTKRVKHCVIAKKL